MRGAVAARRRADFDIKVRSHMRGTDAGGGGRKLASTQIITCVHTCAVAERRRSGGKIRSATNGSNTQFSASASKPRAPNHLCPQEMADPPASTPRMCEHTRGGRVGVSKSARLRSATAPRMCERKGMFTHARSGRERRRTETIFVLKKWQIRPRPLRVYMWTYPR